MLTILIADDHPVVRIGLKDILKENASIAVIDEASNTWEVFANIRKKNYDAVLLDIAMPGGSGLDVLIQLKSMKPELPVLIISMYPEKQYAIQALKAGASGYLTKESAPDELLIALRKILKGGKYVSSSQAEQLANYIAKDTDKLKHEKLSIREYQVMLLIGSGKSVKEIGDELSLSVKTISTYRSRILVKMNLTNNSEIFRYVRQHRLEL